jgi:prephenate dehydrogenase
MPREAAFRNVAIIGGRGAVGRLFNEVLTASGAVTLLLDNKPLPGDVPSNVLAIDILNARAEALQPLSACDLVILATPEHVAIEALESIAGVVDPGALLVETLSVKTGFARQVSTTDIRCECLGVNPMFAPDLGFHGNSVIATPHRAGARSGPFQQLMSDHGARVVVMTPDDHDRACASLQVATHAAILGFGHALLAAGYDARVMTEIMPPPHRTLLALLSRLLAGEPAVYHDIQVANPHARMMREQLRQAQLELDSIVDAGPEAFARELEALRGLLATSDLDFAALCARLFAVR